MKLLREKWFHYFDPRVVIVVVSKLPDGGFHQAAFSWVTPVSKTKHIAISMRSESQTFKNLLQTAVGEMLVTINLLPSRFAQDVLLMKREENPFRFKLMHTAWEIPMLMDAEATFFCKHVSPVNFLWYDTHCLCVFEVLDGVLHLTNNEPMMFFHERTFARAEPFEVEGY